MDFKDFNKKFWDHNARLRRNCSRKCTSEDIYKARAGKPDLYILPQDPIPISWHPPSWNGLDVFALGLGGGYHTPLLAAAGANVTCLDISAEQLKIDEELCRQEGLEVNNIQGDVRDLSEYPSQSFDFIVTSTVILYLQKIEFFWSEVFRLLRPGGVFINGVINPVYYTLDSDEYAKYNLVMKNQIPFDSTQVTTTRGMLKKKKLLEPFQFGHSLSDVIGGQIDAGFKITGLTEGFWGEDWDHQPIDDFLPSIIALRAQKAYD